MGGWFLLFDEKQEGLGYFKHPNVSVGGRLIMIRIDALPGAGEYAMDLSVDDNTLPEQGLISMTARAASASEAQKLGMLDTALSAAETGNPADMLRAFSMAQDHHLQVETIAVCTRKMVSAVETLLKS